MTADQDTLAVLATLYDAALDDNQWPVALHALADATGSQAATFWVLDNSGEPRLPAFTSYNFDPDFVNEYLDHMAPLDPTVRYLSTHPDEPIVHDGLYLTDRDIDCHPYYDWHLRHTDTRYRLLGQIHPEPDLQAGIALHRTRKAGRFEQDDIDRFKLLYEHLKRALTIGLRMGSLASTQRAMTDVLDHHPLALLLLDRRARVIHVNASAEAISEQEDGIRFSRGTLSLTDPGDRRRLEQLIAQALGRAPTEIATGASMQVRRPSGKRPYVLLVSPVSSRQATLSTGRAAVCVAITDPAGDRPIATEHLHSVFGLTEAEARLAGLLAVGKDLRGAAQQIGIRYSTARARLADIFQKTQTNRQAELVNLLLATLAMMS